MWNVEMNIKLHDKENKCFTARKARELLREKIWERFLYMEKCPRLTRALPHQHSPKLYVFQIQLHNRKPKLWSDYKLLCCFAVYCLFESQIGSFVSLYRLSDRLREWVRESCDDEGVLRVWDVTGQIYTITFLFAASLRQLTGGK